ncbi:MAG: DUF1501 domain-containing protein [Bryobacterales bacterium]|nr:DUF1501 domain-containing protein [Bryobacterales bacterium]
MRSRREFLRKITALGAAGAGFTRLGSISANAQTAGGYRALVCVFLFGGNDGGNMVVPLDTARYTQYQRGRGGLALPSTQLGAVTAKAGAESYGIHPQLEPLRQLYLQKRMAVVLNVGTLVRPVTKTDIRNGAPVPDNLYSHSDQTQQWQTSNPRGGRTGWGGRSADLIQSYNTGILPPGISVNGNSLLLLGAQTGGLNVSPGSRLGVDSFGSEEGTQARQAAMAQILTFDSGVTMISTASGVMNTALQAAAEVNAALNSAPPITTVFPQSGLGQQLAQVAQIMAARGSLGMNRQIFFAGMGGFDNHNDLISSQQGLYGALGPAVAAFYNATVELGIADQVTTFTESEFGRTFNVNTGNGSDHAWGSQMMVVGGAVNGGDAYGRLPVLEMEGPDDAGSRGLWIPSTALDQYAATLAQWFGVQPVDLPVVFPNLPNFAAPTLGFL